MLTGLITTAPSTASAPLAPTPSEWASRCSAQSLGLGQDTVQLAPVLSSDKTPSGGRIVSRPNSEGKWVPVIMVHGWTSRSTHVDARTGAFSHIIDLSANPAATSNVTRSLIGQLQGIAGAAVFTFDYHPYSGRWVDDAHLGPALGEVIDCLYRASSQKVIIVAHSLGGLIARYAATQPGIAGNDRAGEISTVVTFGTPETGSVAALLGEAGIDAGAATNDTLAVTRLLLSVCGRLASGDIETDTLCDEIPAPIRAFESDAGIALRAGSPQLAALEPWPRSIYLDALAGNVTFELPDPGWFSLPWSTKSVDVGDVIVTQRSALSHATNTKNATCRYQLNAARGATDQLGLLFGQVARSEVAQQPLKAFTGACFHTDLMRGIELTGEALGAVADDINARVTTLTISQVLNSSIPAGSCGDGKTVGWKQPVSIKLHNGDGVARFANGSFAGSSMMGAKVLGFADIDGDGRKDVVLEFTCIGSTPDLCCAGRASHATFIDALSIDGDRKLHMIGPVIRAGVSLPGDQYGPADRDIRSASLTGTTVTTLEYIYYYEQYTPAQVGGRDPLALVPVQHRYLNGRWVMT